MALMHPDTLDGRRATEGEARVFAALKRVLTPDRDHWVWYEPVIRRSRRRAPEPDFVLLGPEYGVLVLEVKDWGAASIQGADAATMLVRDPEGREQRHTHPMRQARDYGYAVKERLESVPGLVHAGGRYQGKLLLPVNWGVVFPNLSRRDLEALEKRGVPLFAGRCLAREDLERTDEEGRRRLLAGFERMAATRFAFTVDDDVRRRVYAGVEPQPQFFDLRSASPAAESAPSEAPAPARAPKAPAAEPREGGEGGEGGGPAGARAPRPGPEYAPLPEPERFPLDKKQTRMARELASPRTLVYGPAGTGKTVFLVARAQYWVDRNPEARVLFTCYNASLASHLRHVFAMEGLVADGERLTVRHYHDLLGRILGRDDIHERTPEFYAALEPRVLQELSRREDVPAYDCILVDEGQDFSYRMIEVLVRLAAPGGEITLVCDPAQDLYGKWSEENLAPFRRHETERLVDCYRNTAPIFALARSVLAPETREAMGLDRLELTRPEDLGREGPPPELAHLGGLDDLVAVIHEAVERLTGQGLPLSQLAVLYPDRSAVPNFPGRLRHSRWAAARDPRFTAEPEDDPAAEPPAGLRAEDRDDLPERPHFAEALEMELKARDIPVEWVARDYATKAAYDISRPRLTLSTVHSAKGMDFDTVILLGADALSVRAGHDLRRSAAILFTGITRARERLVLPFFLDRNWVPELRSRLAAIGEAGER